MPIPKPALSLVALIIVAGWAAAGATITATAVISWPPVSSPLLFVAGWELITLWTGVTLAAGGGIVLVAAHPSIKLSTRWRLETSGVWLMAGGWITYGILSWHSSGAVAVVLIIAAHVAAAATRLRDLRHEERATRALPGAEGGQS